MLWLVSFSVTVLVDIDYGLGCGLLFSLLVLFKRYFDPVVAKLGWVPNTDIYLELDNYQSVSVWVILSLVAVIWEESDGAIVGSV